MKSKAKELDVDFIGGQDPMSQEEEKAISEFIKGQKLSVQKRTARVTQTQESQKNKRIINPFFDSYRTPATNK